MSGLSWDTGWESVLGLRWVGMGYIQKGGWWVGYNQKGVWVVGGWVGGGVTFRGVTSKGYVKFKCVCGDQGTIICDVGRVGH